MSTRFDGSRIPILVAVCAPVFGSTGDEPMSHLPIDGWREWRRVRDVIAKAKDPYTGRGVPLKLVRLHPPTLANLRQALHTGRSRPAYPMVHIIGYVVPKDGLLRMEQENGREAKVTPEDLVTAFRDAGVQIALLNICSGLEFAKALIRAGVAAVVTTCREISDPEATLLAREIYLRLASGDSIKKAYTYAQESIIEAYRQRQLPPLDGRDDRNERALEQYGRQRADNIVLIGNSDVRLPLPSLDEAADEPEFGLSEPPNNLSHPDETFVGRGRELVQISDWMNEHRFRIITLTGIGGVGKSSLALTAALRNSWRFQGVIYWNAEDAVGPRKLILDDVCQQVGAVLGLGNDFSSLTTLEAKCQRVAEVLNAHPYLLVFDNIDTLSTEQNAELERLIQLIDPRSGTVVLITLRREHFPPLVDPIQGNRYNLPVEPLDPIDAVTLLGELLKPPVEREPTKNERAVWERVPSRHVSSSDRSRLETLANRCDVPDEKGAPLKVAALEELAKIAYRHPLLLRFAAADLKGRDNKWDTVLRLTSILGQLLSFITNSSQDDLYTTLRSIPEDLSNKQYIQIADRILACTEKYRGTYTSTADDRFIGRGRKLVELVLRFSTGSIVMITGLDGIGKTSLANEFYKLLKSYRRPSWLDCTNERSLVAGIKKGLPKDIASELEFLERNPNITEQARILAEKLDEDSIVLFIDSYERVLSPDRATKLLLDLQGHMRKGKIIIATCEESKNLSIAARGPMQLDPLSKDDSIALLRSIGRDMKNGLHGDEEALEKIYRICDGHPFLLQLAATNYPFLPEDDIDTYLRKLVFEELPKPCQQLLCSIAVFRIPLGDDKIKKVNKGVKIESSLRILRDKFLISYDENLKKYSMARFIQAFVMQTNRKAKRMHAKAAKALLTTRKEITQDNYGDFIEAHYHLVQAGKYNQADEIMGALFPRLYAWGKWDELIDMLDVAQESLRRQGIFRFIKARIAKNQYNALRGILYISQGEADKGGQICKDALRKLSKYRFIILDGGRIKQALYGLIGVSYRLTGEYDKALLAYDNALKRGKNDSASIYSEKGKTYWLQGKYVQALEMHEKALSIAGKSNNREDMIFGYLGKAFVHCSKKEYDEALNMCDKVSELLHEGEIVLKAELYNKLGEVHAFQGQLDQAFQELKKALEIAKKLNAAYLIADIMNNIGIVYHKKHDYPSALEKYNEALRIATLIGYKHQMADAYFNIGNLSWNKGDALTAKSHLSEACNLYEQLGARDGLEEAQKLLRLLIASAD